MPSVQIPPVQVQILRADGTPAQGALVSIADAPVSMPDIGRVADAAGRVTIDAPVPGRYLLSIWLDGREERVRCEWGATPGATVVRLAR